MSISDCDKVLLESLYKLNRPIVTIFTLHKILNDNGHSVLTKSLFYFYYRIFKEKDMFERINSLRDNDCLPWLLPSEKELWGNPFMNNKERIEEKEETKVKDEEVWRAYLTKWYKLFFKNSIFYPKWSEEDGYGLYCRNDIIDIRIVLQDPILLYGTFLESITEVDKEVLEAFGFCSFFEYKTADESKISPYSVLCGLLMLANSSQQVLPDCPISFEHVYQFDDDNEVDCNIGDPYRTIVCTKFNVLTTKALIILILILIIILIGNWRK